eukprot:3320483-Prymnesium_polylepis.1
MAMAMSPALAMAMAVAMVLALAMAVAMAMAMARALAKAMARARAAVADRCTWPPYSMRSQTRGQRRCFRRRRRHGPRLEGPQAALTQA